MSKILDIEDGKLVITPEALGISFFKALWSRDKTTTKTKAYKDILYVYYYCDFRSPYFAYPPDQREALIKEDVICDTAFKVDKEVTLAIDGYNKLNKTPMMKFLEDASMAVFAMGTYLKDPDSDPEKMQKLMINLPKMVASVNEALALAQKEQAGTNRVRGDQQISLLEEGKL